MNLIEPKTITITTQAGTEKNYIISKMPYASGGREVLTQFIPTAAPTVGDYQANEALMLKMMGFVAVESTAGAPIQLTTRALIDNHVPDFRTGVELEKAMLEYNFGFFELGAISDLSGTIASKAQAWITKILTDSLEQSSAKGKQA